jgi:hypothetical protein
VEAAGDLVRHIALAQSGISRSLPAHSRPEIPTGSLRSTEPSETTGQAKFLRGYVAVWGMGSERLFLEGDYLRPFASEVWTICVPCLLLLITKKEIATGVMNHDRFVGIDAPYRDAQQGR